MVVWRDRREGGKERRLVTEYQARELGERYSRWFERDQFKSCVKALGLPLDAFDSKEVELLVERGLATPEEVCWDLANAALQEAVNEDNHRCISAVYATMARALYEEGQQHFRLQQEAHKAFLRSLAAEGATSVQLGSVCSCPVCEPMRHERWSVADALEQLPVPHERCDMGFCECWWSGG